MSFVLEPEEPKGFTLQPEEPPSAKDRAKRVLGLGARAVGPQAAGALVGGTIGSVVPGVGTVLGAGAGATAATIAQLADSLIGTKAVPRMMDAMGLPQPATSTERIATDVTGAMASLGGQVAGLSQLARPLNPTAPTAVENIAGQLIQQPGRQATAVATGQGAASMSRESGGTEAEQRAAGLIGGFAPFASQMIPRGANTVADETLRRARDAGYVVPPSQLPGAGPLTRKAEGFGGKIMTSHEASLKNQEITDNIARQAIGLRANEPISVATIEQVRTRAGQPYRELAQISPQADQTLNALRDARHEATQQFRFYERSANPEALRLARAADAQAHALETQLENMARQSGRPELVARMRESRALIARTYDVERSLNLGDGHIDARILGRLLDRGRPMTGGLRTAAEFAEAHPGAVKSTAQVGSPVENPFNWTMAGLLGAGGYGATGSPYGALLAGAPFLRSPVRSVLLSSPYQNMLMPHPNPITPGNASMLGLISGMKP